MKHSLKGYAVVDVETTGLSSSDRIIEIAIVTLDLSLKTTGVFETLINPQQNLGPTFIHGITRSMVANAPRFADIGKTIAERLNDHVLVAHNRPFEVRMLSQEYQRLDASYQFGSGVCTYRLTKQRLPDACDTHGVMLPTHHEALSDAQGAAALLRKLKPDVSMATPVQIRDVIETRLPRTLQRSSFRIQSL